MGEINCIFGTHDRFPAQYMFSTLDRNELISLYRICEIAFMGWVRISRA
ncbi:MAG: hypothetical protein HN978_10990 [Desulfobacula sp.]|nr:hypothetical protein [Desulfobacula sp.]MBT4508089.1 hypothetical protein [Desulfobacula sp.]MBT5972235.1 hypothetical protein [Desulfobacula sp.]MBT7050189.1 hypothetical protein [Desulfobacula sp.]